MTWVWVVVRGTVIVTVEMVTPAPIAGGKEFGMELSIGIIEIMATRTMARTTLLLNRLCSSIHLLSSDSLTLFRLLSFRLLQGLDPTFHP